MALGDYEKTTYVEGSPPGISAARLNKNENKTKELDDWSKTHLADDAKEPSDTTHHVKKDSTLQTGLNAEKVGSYKVWVGIQDDYDDIENKDANTLYFVK